MNLYIYARDLGKAICFQEKSIYVPKKSDHELLGHTLSAETRSINYFLNYLPQIISYACFPINRTSALNQTQK